MDYGALVQAAVGIIGELLAADQKEEAAALLGRMRTQFEGIPLPSLEEIEAQQLGPSALEGIKADPTLEKAQYDSLGQIGEVADTGMGAQDRAALNTIANMTARRQRAGMANIENEMASRGMAGSGMDVAARMANAQDANQRLSEAGMNVAGDSANRRMQAILAKGDMSGRMRGQQYSEKANAAAARDAIMKFNAQSRDSANRFNQGQRQQRFQNQIQKTSAVANPTNAIASFNMSNAQDTRQLAAGAGASARKFVNSWDDDEEEKDKNK